MSNIQDLIETTDRLCANLDRIIAEERQFNEQLSEVLEYTRQSYGMCMQELKYVQTCLEDV